MTRDTFRFFNARPFISVLVFPLMACWSVFGQGQIDGSEYPPSDRPAAQSTGNGWPRVDRAQQPDDSSGQPPLAAPEDPRMSGDTSNPSRPFNDESVPNQLVLRPGTFVTVRVNQTLSSDHNQPGDSFSATLVKPVVVDGIVVARPGQTLGGQVTLAQKAGRVEGVSRLSIQLTDMTLVDGQQVPIQSQLISRGGGTSIGRDAGAIAGTSALGAAIGAAAGWGTGAAIGAGAGAAAGTLGVLLTRGHPTIIDPESVLTFRIENSVAMATDRAPQAFRYIQPGEYDQPAQQPQQQSAGYGPPAPCGGYGCAPPPAYYYGPAYYPFVGTSVLYFGGPRYFYGPRYAYGFPRYYGPYPRYYGYHRYR
jgi:hypothetical protein